MNESFSMNRFWLLVRRQWIENKKVYLLQWCIISLLVMALQFLGKDNELSLLLYLLLFCFSGCAVTATLFSRWKDKSKSALYLLLPATVTEKFLCGLLYGIVLFIPIYFLNYFVFRYFIAYLLIMIIPNNLISLTAIITVGIHEIISTPFSTIIVIFLSFLFTQSIFITIFIRYKKNQVLIFLLTTMAILILYNYGMGIFMRLLVKDFEGSIRAPGLFLTFFSPDFWCQEFKSFSGEYFSFTRLIWGLNNLVWFMVFCILYIAAGYKLREREI